jgi:anti-sigma B factor antagonist
MPDIKITEYQTGANKDVTVIVLDGSVDAYNSEVLSKRLDEMVKKECFKIIIDCAKLNFISSSGMGVFLAMEDELAENGGGFKFIAVPATILNVFKKVGIADIFKIYDDESEAVEEFKKGL